MTPASRSKGWWGLGLVIVLGILGVLYLSGVVHLNLGKAKPKALCYVSPKNPNFIKETPGKDPEGNELVPVYPTGTPGQPPPPAVMPQAAAPAPTPGAAGEPQKGRKIKYWVSPMDPGYVRDKPGKAPCGMDLVPVYEEAGEEAPGTIKISPATIQSMGVRTAKVEVRPLSRLTLAVGMVTFDERNLNVITTKVDGWVERLYVNATGDPVRKGQTLLSIYSPNLVSAQEEYLLAVRNLEAVLRSYGVAPGEFIHIHPASRWHFKYWPVEQMARLIERLHADGYQVVLSAAPDSAETTMLDAIQRRLSRPAVSLAGQFSLKDLAALIARARLFIGVDSAPMYIVAAVGTPCVVLFGPSGDKEWGP